MTNNMRLGQAATLLLFIAMAMLMTASASIAEDYVGMTNYYKARAEAINASVGHKTAYGALLTARAGHIKAQGEYIKNRADAFVATQNGRKIGQEIFSMKLDNSLKRAEVFYKKRNLYHAYRKTHRRKRSSPGELASRAKKGLPAQLTSHELSSNGRIWWPRVLMGQQFAANRAMLDAIFASGSYGFSSEESCDVKNLTDDMKTKLKSLIKEVSPTDYLAAKRLLQGLAHEARTAPPLKPNRVAIR